MVCGDLMDDAKYLEHLAEGAVSCTLSTSYCTGRLHSLTCALRGTLDSPFSRTFVSAGSSFFCTASSLEGSTAL